MKTTLLTLGQCVLFLVAFAAGSFLVPLHLRQVLSATVLATRVFVWDGVVLMLALLALLLVVEFLRKRLRQAAPWTALALLLAAGIGLALRLGFMTIER